MFQITVLKAVILAAVLTVSEKHPPCSL